MIWQILGYIYLSIALIVYFYLAREEEGAFHFKSAGIAVIWLPYFVYCIGVIICFVYTLVTYYYTDYPTIR